MVICRHVATDVETMLPNAVTLSWQPPFAVLSCTVYTSHACCADVQQTQQTIQSDLVALRAVVSTGSLPFEQETDQQTFDGKQEAVLSSTQQLLGAVEVSTALLECHKQPVPCSFQHSEA